MSNAASCDTTVHMELRTITRNDASLALEGSACADIDVNHAASLPDS